jgi:hypothetical protein
MANLFDWLFEPTKSTSSSTTSLPEWVTNAGKSNYALATGIAQRPYQAYGAPRVAGFSPDQTSAMGALRTATPRALTLPAGGYRPPRLIDNIPGGEGPGGISDYENPYTENVINRGIAKMREAANIGQQNINNRQHMSESFGDARHGLEAEELERDLIKEIGDFSGQQYAQGYDTAQQLRESDIERLMRSQDLARADQSDLLTWIDAMFRSGSNQQELTQKSLSTAYADFLRQQNYPKEMLDVLTAALTGTPSNVTKTTEEPGPSNAASILSTIGSVLGAII